MAEIDIPAPRLEQRRIDLGTGLPNLAVAWEDIAHLSQSLDVTHCLGIIDVAILPDPVLLRLSPEASRDLRLEITRRLESALRPQDHLYALEHWEWLVVLGNLPSSAPLMLALIKLDALFAEPVRALDESRLLLRVACGGALCPDNGTEARHLVQSARIACLRADRSGSRYATYSPEMEQSDKVQQQLHTELPHALSGAPGLSLYLQPQIDLADGGCRACEALLRWQLPTGE